MGAVQVRHEPASAALVRRLLAQDLRDYDLPEASVDAAVLVVSELIGNAVLHAPPSAHGTLNVSWDMEDAGVVVRVGDGSLAVPTPRSARPDEPNGRGMAIIEAVADGWGVERGVHGKQVWARIPVAWDQVEYSQMA